MDDDENDVIIRRVINSKKDQYFINNKGATRDDIVNLFDRAEITSSNPYFIVKQGNIQRIATAPDTQRLKLLLEVSGANLFNENISSWEREQAKSASTLRELKKYANENDRYFLIMTEQKDDYIKFQKLDIERRCLEHAILGRDLKMNKRKLKTVSLAIEEKTLGTESSLKKLKKKQKALEVVTHEFNEQQNECDFKIVQREILRNEEQELKNKDMSLELKINDLKEEKSRKDLNVQETEENLKLFQTEIEDINIKLEEFETDYLKAKAEDEKLNLELKKKEQDRKELYEKQGRQAGKCFSSKEERDKWIKIELDELTEQIAIDEEYKKEISGDLTSHRENEKKLRCDIERKIAEEKEIRASFDKNDVEFHKHTREIDTERCKRKELFREENKLQQQLNGLEEKLIESEKEMRKIVGVSVMNGMKSVGKILSDFPEYSKGYHGMVVEKINKINPGCEKAISLTAGNRLFHHIIDNESIGINILKEMKRQNLPGDVTFLPLKRIGGSRSANDLIKDYISSISMIEYDPRFSNIMSSIFGNTLLARDNEAALKQLHKNDCVTLDGFQVFKDGRIVGGYSGAKTHLEIFDNHTKNSSERNTVKEKLEKIHDDIQKVNEELSKSIDFQGKYRIKNDKNESKYNELRKDIQLLKEQQISMKEFRKKKEEILFEYALSLERIYSTKRHLEQELNQDLSSQPFSQDQRELDELNNEIINLENEKKETAKKCKEYEEYERESDDLKKHRDTLEKFILNNSTANLENQIQTWESERENITDQLEKLSDTLKELDKDIKKLLKEKSNKFEEIKKLKYRNEEIENKLKDIQDDVRELITQKSCLQQNIDECTEKTLSLGALPNLASYSKFDDFSTNQMFHRMSAINIQLGELNGVNRNALNNYSNFKDRIKNINQKVELAMERNESILGAIESLEQQKNEAIKRTLKSVNKYFNQLFKKIVVNGSAELINTESQESFQGDDYVPDELTGIGTFKK